MKSKIIKRSIWTAVILFLIFYVSPTILVDRGMHNAFDAHPSSAPKSKFYKGHSFLNMASYFPGFGTDMDKLKNKCYLPYNSRVNDELGYLVEGARKEVVQPLQMRYDSLYNRLLELSIIEYTDSVRDESNELGTRLEALQDQIWEFEDTYSTIFMTDVELQNLAIEPSKIASFCEEWKEFLEFRNEHSVSVLWDYPCHCDAVDRQTHFNQ